MKKPWYVAVILSVACLVLCPLSMATESKSADTAKELTWQDNSKAMYDKVVESSPAFIRAKSEKKLRESIVQKAGPKATVTEKMVLEATRETTPGPFVDMTLKKLEPLRTKK